MNPQNYDLFVEIVNGRIDGDVSQSASQDTNARDDLNNKIAELAKTELFKELDRKQQRLLAFGAQWYKAEAGRMIFAEDEEADAAYLCITGMAGLYWTSKHGEKRLVSEIYPGRLIGDLSVIMKEKRPLELVAIEDCLFLRIGATEFTAVIENDAMVASNLLRSVAGNMTGVVSNLRSMRTYANERGIDFTEFDAE